MNRIKQFKILTVIALIFTIGYGCMNEKIDFENISDNLQNHRKHSGPLVKGSYSFMDIYEQFLQDENEDDTIVVFDGDTVKLIFGLDSILDLDLGNFEELNSTYSTTDSVFSETFYPIDFDSATFTRNVDMPFSNELGIRVDSILMNGGNFELNVESSFQHEAIVTISSPLMTNASGEKFEKTFQLSAGSGNFTGYENIDLTGYKIRFKEINDTSHFYFEQKVKVYESGSGVIQPGDKALVEFTFSNLKDYEVLWGNVGRRVDDIDTIIESPLGEELAGITGRFAITDPRISFNYINSLGIPIDLDINLTTFRDGSGILVDADQVSFDYPANYLADPSEGTITYRRDNIQNLDSVFRFPPADSFHIDMKAIANPNDTELGETKNFVLKDSRFILNVDLELPLELYANMTYTDTLEAPDLGDDSLEVDFAELHYYFTNEFPLDIEVFAILYDSAENKLYDTLNLNDSPGSNLFLKAAPVDQSTGLVILDQVQEHHGYIALSPEEISRIQKVDKMILFTRINTYNAKVDPQSKANILSTYRLNFQFALDAEFTLKDF